MSLSECLIVLEKYTHGTNPLIVQLTMLEKLASLHNQMAKELRLATTDGGASVSSAKIAESLLVRESFDDFFTIRNSGGVSSN